jgi:tetraacyldisaccharide 4'-kinase
VLILDDGLHSRALTPDFALLVVDADYGAGNGLCLPAGPLRAPLAAQIAASDIVLVIGEGAAGDAVAALAHSIGKPTLRARVQPTRESAQRLSGRRVFAFAGVARPQKFLRSLHEAGAVIVGTRWFDDHHRFSNAEMDELERAAGRATAVLATTEKDAVRMGPRISAETLPIELLFERQQDVCALLSRALDQRRSSCFTATAN